MDASLWRLLNEERETTVTLRDTEWKLVLLPACELMALYTALTAGEDEFLHALQSNAALVAKVLRTKEGIPVFEHADAVLAVLSAEEIHGVVDTYRRWSGAVDPGFWCTEEELDALKKV